jgi:hypothetical protein
MISLLRRTFSCVLVGFGALVATSKAAAQVGHLEVKAVGQIVNEALEAVVPSSGPTPHPVWKREVRFDHQRTLEAFRLSPAVLPSELDLRHPVKPGTRELLDDCDELGQKPCQRLGRTQYAYVEPISISPSEARVRVYLISAHRGTGSFSSKSYLASSYTVVYLNRTADGSWKHVRTGSTNVF